MRTKNTNNNLTNNMESEMKSRKDASEAVATQINASTTNLGDSKKMFDHQIEPAVEDAIYTNPTANSTTPLTEELEPSFRRANARTMASIRNVRIQKQKSLKSYQRKLRTIRNTIKRGYYIFEKEQVIDEKEVVVKIHHKLDEAEREFLRKKREELRIKILALQNEIEEYTANLKSQSYRTKMSFSSKYSKMVLDRKLKKATSRIRGIIEKQLLKDSRNGKREVLLGIRVETDEVNQKQSFLDYIGTILSPNDLHYFEIPQLQESITKRGLVYLKETEF